MPGPLNSLCDVRCFSYSLVRATSPQRFFELVVRFAMSLVCLLADKTHAGHVQFDVIPFVPCETLADVEFPGSLPGEKLVRARCQVSILSVVDGVRGPNECLFHFYSPEPHTRVHDFSPKTTLATDVVGTIQVTREGERNEGLRVGASGDVHSLATAEISANQADRQAHSQVYAQLPPRELVAAAGTLGRGSGVYFKLRRSSQESLEGTHEFSIVLRVPAAWRAGYLRLTCQAKDGRGRKEGDTAPLASASFLVPLYLAGDSDAKHVALELMEAEQSLIAAALQQENAIRHASRPSMWYEIALKPPRVPDQWLASILRQPAEATPFPFESELPAEIGQAIERVRTVKRNVRIWSEQSASLTGCIDTSLTPGG